MKPELSRSATRSPLHGATCDWTCRLCTYGNPEDEDICCQRCGATKP